MAPQPPHALVADGGITVDDFFAEAERPLTDWLSGHTDSTFVLWASDNLVEPTMRILVVVIVAWIAVRLARRAILRAVARTQDPDAPRGGRLRARMSFLDDPQPPRFSTRRAQRADSLGALAVSVASFTVWILAFFMVLGTFGLNLGPLIAGAGILGVALGFGAQNLVRDFISGVAMLLEDQYGVGDVIDAGEAMGVVEGITLRTTRLRDITGTLWHIPNGEIHRVGNSSQEWSRAVLDVGVGYGADIDVAAALILQVARDMRDDPDHAETIIDDPEIWGVQSLGDSSVDIRLVVKTTPGTQWALARELRRRIKIALDAAHIEIPFPQRTVWMRTEEPLAVGDADTPVYEVPTVDQETLDAAAASVRRAAGVESTDPQDQPPEA